jgi:hypothetical protein
MFGYFSGNNPPQPTLLKQLENVRAKAKATGELTVQYNKRVGELNKLNKVLTNGYVNNLNVIVDLSKLLTEYGNTINEIMSVLLKFDNSILDELKGTDLEYMKELTSDKLEQVSKFFVNDVSKVKELLISLGKVDVSDKLDRSRSNFNETYEQGIKTQAILQGGRKKKVYKKKVIIRKRKVVKK